MGTAGDRIRRSALSILVAAAGVTVLAVTSTAAAQGHDAARDRAAGAGTSARTDVFIRDVATDVGTEPHALNPLWQSPDIKVCPTAVECAVSQNPIVGVTNYVFVRLRNPGPYGSGLDNGVLKVYRTTPGGGAVWPIHWTQIGAASVPVAAGTTTVTIPWTGVPGPGHFCLLARWVSPTDPMTIEGPDISINTRYNNNIAWRNVDSVRLVAGGGPVIRPFAIGNPLTVPAKSNLVFTQPQGGFQAVGGRLVADLGPTLFDRWRAAGATGTGIKVVGENQVEIVDPARASLDNLTLNPNERLEFTLAFAAAAPTDGTFALDVTQFGPNARGEENTDLGGVRYDITVGQK